MVGPIPSPGNIPAPQGNSSPGIQYARQQYNAILTDLSELNFNESTATYSSTAPGSAVGIFQKITDSSESVMQDPSVPPNLQSAFGVLARDLQVILQQSRVLPGGDIVYPDGPFDFQLDLNNIIILLHS